MPWSLVKDEGGKVKVSRKPTKFHLEKKGPFWGGAAGAIVGPDGWGDRSEGLVPWVPRLVACLAKGIDVGVSNEEIEGR